MGTIICPLNTGEYTKSISDHAIRYGLFKEKVASYAIYVKYIGILLDSYRNPNLVCMCVCTCVHNLLIVCPLILNYVHTVSRARVRTHYTTLFAHIESFGLARVY